MIGLQERATDVIGYDALPHPMCQSLLRCRAGTE